jgi:flagellar L-ring protein precursor FlgH
MLLFFLACAAGPLAQPPHAMALPPLPPPPAPRMEVGSLWSEESARVLVGDNNSRAVGDAVTVLIDESTLTQLNAGTKADRTSGAGFEISSLLGLETTITKANEAMGGKIGLGGSSSSNLDGSGSTSREGTVRAVLTCQVVQVMTNGLLQLEGRKQVVVNNETQFVTLRAAARARDIALDNTLESLRLIDAQVEITGAGVLANQQRQGWGTSIANSIWPF